MKKILITGTGSGIGLGITQRLLTDHCQVIGLSRCHDAIISKNYIPIKIDFNEVNEIEKSLQTIKKNHMDIDAVICCAGYGRFGELEQFSDQQIINLMNVNFISQAIVIKNFLPLLKRRPQAKIILLGSEAALIGAKKGSIYCASKFALRGLSQSLREECRKTNVAVTLLNPGLVRTNFFKTLNFMPSEESEKHALEIDDIVDAVYWILSAPHHRVIEEINLQPLQPKIFIKNK